MMKKNNLILHDDSLSACPFRQQYFLAPYGALVAKIFRPKAWQAWQEPPFLHCSTFSDLLTKRPKLSDKKSFVAGKQFIWTMIKMFGVAVSKECELVFLEVYQQLQDGINTTDLTLDIDLPNFPRKMAFELFRFLSLEIMQRYTEEQLLKICSVKIVDRLTRNPIKSAIVKASKHGKLGACWRMLRAGFYSNCMFYSACFVFDSAIIAVEEVSKKSKNQQASFRQFWKKIGAMTHIYILHIGGVAIGGCMGTAFYPGEGTRIGMKLGDFAAGLFSQQDWLKYLHWDDSWKLSCPFFSFHNLYFEGMTSEKTKLPYKYVLETIVLSYVQKFWHILFL